MTQISFKTQVVVWALCSKLKLISIWISIKREKGNEETRPNGDLDTEMYAS